MVILRAATPDDLAGISAIYGAAARSSVATFDLEAPPLSYWQAKLADDGPGTRMIVAVEQTAVDPDGVDADGVDADGVEPAGVDADGVEPAGVEPTGVGPTAVVGFAYSGWFRPRPAYGATRETSIYLGEGARGQGLGRRLYAELLELLRADGMHLAVAVVAQPNPASDALHLALGYEVVGTFDEVGHKFGRYVSTRWYQLRL